MELASNHFQRVSSSILGCDGKSRSPKSINQWKSLSKRLDERMLSYYQTFLPRTAIEHFLDRDNGSNERNDNRALAEQNETVVLIVDITGFTSLCDRFQVSEKFRDNSEINNNYIWSLDSVFFSQYE